MTNQTILHIVWENTNPKSIPIIDEGDLSTYDLSTLTTNSSAVANALQTYGVTAIGTHKGIPILGVADSGTTYTYVGIVGTAMNVNIKLINGVTPLMGNGNTGTGSPRVTIADNNSPITVKTDQTTPGSTDRVTANVDKIAGVSIDNPNSTITTGVIASSGNLLAAHATLSHKIFEVIIGADTAGIITLSDGMGAMPVSQNGQAVFRWGNIGKTQTTPATAITMTNSNGGNLYATGTYRDV